MENPIVIALMIAGGIVIVAVIIMIVRYYEKKRTEALQAAASAMGLTFSGRPGADFLPTLGAFTLFSQGHSKKAANMMSGIIDGIDMAIFDYRYTTGGGKNSHTHSQTVFLLKSDSLSLPAFSLRPENVFHKIGKAFGYQDIDWDSHPEFSDKYLLRAADEAACREAFSDDILEYYQQRPGLSTEGSGNRLIFFRASKKVKPENLATFLKDGLHVYTLFTKGG
ncbi:MAG: hypothetical protein HQ556_13415 [Candidatus Marinimicrobia bacterium]|nr:hypothetical protein [Candidatus Neomarinimicrobiota bacterium]